jgi:hypothetical protein
VEGFCGATVQAAMNASSSPDKRERIMDTS